MFEFYTLLSKEFKANSKMGRTTFARAESWVEISVEKDEAIRYTYSGGWRFGEWKRAIRGCWVEGEAEVVR